MSDDVVSVGSFQRWLSAFADQVAEQSDYLTDLDAAIGDADHGANLRRGSAAVLTAAAQSPPESVAAAAKQTAMALISTVGGASGPLYGTFFLRLAAAVGDDPVDAAGFGAGLAAGVQGIQARGKASLGDKTMLDAWLPAVTAYQEATPDGLAAALSAAAGAAARGRDDTAPLIARKGRASYLGDRSAGHIDPGAASTAILLQTAADTLAAAPGPGTAAPTAGGGTSAGEPS